MMLALRCLSVPSQLSVPVISSAEILNGKTHDTLYSISATDGGKCAALADAYNGEFISYWSRSSKLAQAEGDIDVEAPGPATNLTNVATHSTEHTWDCYHMSRAKETSLFPKIKGILHSRSRKIFARELVPSKLKPPVSVRAHGLQHASRSQRPPKHQRVQTSTPTASSPKAPIVRGQRFKKQRV